MTYKLVPIFGRGFKGKSAPVTAQRRLNAYVELPEDPDKSPMVMYGRPGLYPQLFTSSTSMGGGPLRGLIRVEQVINVGLPSQQTIDMVFSGQSSYALVSRNNPTAFLSTNPTPAFRTTSGPIVYADNGFEVIGVDGESAYIAAYSIGSFTQTDMQSIPVANFPYGAESICFLAGRFVAPDPSRPGVYMWSDLNDGFTWSGDFATAESIPDALTATYSFRGELILFGSRSIEWAAPTADSRIFGRVGGAAVSWGLYSRATVCEVDDALMFAAVKESGDLEIVVMQGYQVRSVSTPDVEAALRLSSLADLSAMTLRSEGHTFYILNTPTRSFVFDLASGAWDEWGTENSRYAGQYSTTAYGRVMITDYRDSRIYGIAPDTPLDDSAFVWREFTLKHVSADLDRITVAEFVLDIETGVGLPSGQGSNPLIWLQVSYDGGRTFGNEISMPMGKLGQYLTRVVWTRIGCAYDFVFRVKVSDPVKVVLIAAALNVAK